MEHMELVRARQADPTMPLEAQARADEVTRRLKGMYVNELATALQNERRPGKKFFWLRKLTDKLATATDGIVPCGVGCSDCCNMATIISVQEAQAISSATGIPHVMPGQTILSRTDVNAEREQFTGVPCTFLKGSRCSIYEHRPHSCRVHYVLDRDALLCKHVPGEEIYGPMFDVIKFNMLWVMAHDHKHPLDMRMADIRDFFPVVP